MRLHDVLEPELLLDYDLEVRFSDGAVQSLEFVGTYFGVVGADLDFRALLWLGLDAVRVDDAAAGDNLVDASLQIVAAGEREDGGQSIGANNLSCSAAPLARGSSTSSMPRSRSVFAPLPVDAVAMTRAPVRSAN